MEISNIENAKAFKEISGLDISKSFFYFLAEKGDYVKIYNLFIDIIDFYGQISAVGLGVEYNPYNKSQLIIDKIGFFGQYSFNSFSKNNKSNLKITLKDKKIYFSHYVGILDNEDIFYKLIHNKTVRVYLEIIEKENLLELKVKEKYIGVSSDFSIRILFGFDLNESLYLILIGDSECLEKIQNFTKNKFEFNCTSKRNILSRITFLDEKFSEVEKIFNTLKL